VQWKKPTVASLVELLERQALAGDGALLNDINGAGLAYASANSHLEAQKRQNLYCAPTKLALNPQNYAEIAIREYRRDKALYDAFSDNPLEAVSVALLRGLESTFPCK
jgi:hypothetical protein